jgi:integrase/recombinase XerD
MSRATVISDLGKVARLLGYVTAEECPWQTLQYGDLVAVLSRLADQGLAAATRKKTRIVLRGILKECWRLDLMTSDAYLHAADLPIPRGTSAPAGRAIPPSELAALFRLLRETPGPTARRNAAMVALAYATGGRVTELVSAEVRDYDGASLTIRRGKGGKWRCQPIPSAGLLKLVDEWLAVRGPKPGALLCACNHGGHVYPERRITARQARNTLLELAAAAGIGHLAPHDLRRTFATQLLRGHVDLDIIKNAMGHSSPATTALYLRGADDAVRNAVDGTIDLPE